jgi:hypothetical protein
MILHLKPRQLCIRNHDILHLIPRLYPQQVGELLILSLLHHKACFARYLLHLIPRYLAGRSMFLALVASNRFLVLHVAGDVWAAEIGDRRMAEPHAVRCR